MELEKIINKASLEYDKLYDYAIDLEAKQSEMPREEVISIMRNRLDIMIASSENGKNQNKLSQSGLSGGDSYKLNKYLESGKGVSGELMLTAAINAIAVSEYNASMGRIVACPTAGSSGILPGVIACLLEQGIEEELIVKGLFTAGLIGQVIEEKASVSGAQGGCQAECGSAAAMAAAMVVDIISDDMNMIKEAAAMALKNIMGLICDPVAGLVEVPCVKRNATQVANALLSADMAMAGICSKIPFDEVVMAMDEVSKMMPSAFRETAEGGVANTPTARAYEKQIFSQEEK